MASKWQDEAPRIDVPEQQGDETRHGSKERREVRKGAEGSQKRTRGGTDCKDVRNDNVNTSTARSVDWACGPNNMDADTRERKKREAVKCTETKRKRLLKKRTRGGGSKGGKTSTELEDADTDD